MKDFVVVIRLRVNQPKSIRVVTSIFWLNINSEIDENIFELKGRLGLVRLNGFREVLAHMITLLSINSSILWISNDM